MAAEPEAAVLRDLAPGGRLRATINLGNPVLAGRNARTGALEGVSVELARELACRLGVDADLMPFETAGKAFEALRGGAAEVGFLAIDAVRAEALEFTDPYLAIEGTYLVPASSSLNDPASVDRAGVRIAAGRNSAYDLHLSRALRHATLVHAPTSQAAVDLFLAGGADAVAGIRQPLAAIAAKRPDLKLVDEAFMWIEQAMTLPRGRPAGARYLRGFVEEMKASGFLAKVLADEPGEETAVPLI